MVSQSLIRVSAWLIELIMHGMTVWCQDAQTKSHESAGLGPIDERGASPAPGDEMRVLHALSQLGEHHLRCVPYSAVLCMSNDHSSYLLDASTQMQDCKTDMRL